MISNKLLTHKALIYCRLAMRSFLGRIQKRKCWVFFQQVDAERNVDLLVIMSDMRSDSPWLLHSLNEISRKYRVILIFVSPTYPKEILALREQLVAFKHVVLDDKKQLLLFIFQLVVNMHLSGVKAIHAHGFIAGFIASFLHTLKVRDLFIYARHHGLTNYVEGNKLVARIDKIISSLASYVVVHSRRTREQLIEQEGLKDDKVIYLPIGINSNEFKTVSSELIKDFRGQFDFDVRDFVVGTNSRAVPLKGLEFVLDAFICLKPYHPNLKLILINVSKSSYYLQKLQKKYNYKDIIFLEKVENVPLFFHSLDLFCHVPISAYAEAAGLVLLEALASGTPSLVTNAGLVQELPLPSNWQVVPYRSSLSIAEAIGFMLAQHREGCAENKSSSNVIWNFPIEFDVESSTKKQIDFYESLFSSTKR